MDISEVSLEDLGMNESSSMVPIIAIKDEEETTATLSFFHEFLEPYGWVIKT